MAQLTADSLPAYAAELTAGVQRCKGLLRKTHYNVLRLLDAFGLYDYFNYLFLLELRRFEASMAAISGERTPAAALLTGGGTGCSVGSFLSAGGQGPGRSRSWSRTGVLSVQEEIYHPLLEQPLPIPYSCRNQVLSLPAQYVR